jgi:hypothetical protein
MACLTPPISSPKIKYCQDLEIYKGKPPCCDSCHEDEAYGLEMLTVNKSGFEYYVCCPVAKWLKENKW